MTPTCICQNDDRGAACQTRLAFANAFRDLNACQRMHKHGSLIALLILAQISGALPPEQQLRRGPVPMAALVEETIRQSQSRAAAQLADVIRLPDHLQASAYHTRCLFRQVHCNYKKQDPTSPQHRANITRHALHEISFEMAQASRASGSLSLQLSFSQSKYFNASTAWSARDNAIACHSDGSSGILIGQC